jgi:hypothetical protein
MLNKDAPHGYNDWRIPTIEELALMRANNSKIGLKNGDYMTSDGTRSGNIRLVTTGKLFAEKEAERIKQEQEQAKLAEERRQREEEQGKLAEEKVQRWQQLFDALSTEEKVRYIVLRGWHKNVRIIPAYMPDKDRVPYFGDWTNAGWTITDYNKLLDINPVIKEFIKSKPFWWTNRSNYDGMQKVIPCRNRRDGFYAADRTWMIYNSQTGREEEQDIIGLTQSELASSCPKCADCLLHDWYRS